MADVQPLRALHYNLEKTGGLQDVIAPPYDVIDAEQRAQLEARSPYSVVRLDLPTGSDPYANAARELELWRAESVIVQDERPALWVLEQDYTGPDGRPRTRRGPFAHGTGERTATGLHREPHHPGHDHHDARELRNGEPKKNMVVSPDELHEHALDASEDEIDREEDPGLEAITEAPE